MAQTFILIGLVLTLTSCTQAGPKTATKPVFPLKMAIGLQDRVEALDKQIAEAPDEIEKAKLIKQKETTEKMLSVVKKARSKKPKP